MNSLRLIILCVRRATDHRRPARVDCLVADGLSLFGADHNVTFIIAVACVTAPEHIAIGAKQDARRNKTGIGFRSLDRIIVAIVVIVATGRHNGAIWSTGWLERYSTKANANEKKWHREYATRLFASQTRADLWLAASDAAQHKGTTRVGVRWLHCCRCRRRCSDRPLAHEEILLLR